jgi:hypothetical protein
MFAPTVEAHESASGTVRLNCKRLLVYLRCLQVLVQESQLTLVSILAMVTLLSQVLKVL